VVSHSDWTLPVATSELTDIRDRCVVEGPESAFVKGFDAFCQANLYAVCQEVVLPQEILFLDFRVESRIVFSRTDI